MFSVQRLTLLQQLNGSWPTRWVVRRDGTSDKSQLLTWVKAHVVKGKLATSYGRLISFPPRNG